MVGSFKIINISNANIFKISGAYILTKLGLKISKDRLFNGFKLSETDALQCKERFMNETRVESPQLSAFGFGNYKSEASIRWPRQIILTQTKSRDEMSESDSQSMVQSNGKK